jgi:hypothetical protein
LSVRRKSLLLEKIAHQSQCGPAVTPTLYLHIEDLAFVVNGTPQVYRWFFRRLIRLAGRGIVRLPMNGRGRPTNSNWWITLQAQLPLVV